MAGTEQPRGGAASGEATGTQPQAGAQPQTRGQSHAGTQPHAGTCSEATGSNKEQPHAGACSEALVQPHAGASSEAPAQPQAGAQAQAAQAHAAERIPRRTFADVRACKEDGLVFLGCGGDLAEWHAGVLGLLSEQGLADAATFRAPYHVVTTGGRVDLVLEFAPGRAPSGDALDKLTMWRMHFNDRGDCSWVSDYVVNYAAHHR